ncbi:rhox homeobox family member 1-like [Arvicola amphibius]|uniref:rhox homeobox family member 1-like n=1 Tax=Arvicola amphibius TaxID=1047088 RepID=UPI0018E385A2|nr:rhox homeobox family member 1-like [Arvicola amphibius]
MARKYFYFDYDFYGVNFYEEEVMTEPEKTVAYTINSGSFDQGIIDALNNLFCEGQESFVYDHSYQGCDMSNSQEIEQEELEMAMNMVEVSEQSSVKIRQKPYIFTPGQLWELRAVFEETQYPDTIRRRELAGLMNVDEQKVKDWFNNKRAKLRKNQRAILTKKRPPPNKDNLDMKTLVEVKNIFILQEQVGDGFFWCRQKFLAHTGQDIPISLPLY